MDREKQKELLKSRKIVFDETAFVEQNHKKPIKNKKQKVFIIVLIFSIILLAFLFFLLTRKYTHKLTFFTKTLSETNTSDAINTVDYVSFEKGLIRYSYDGASYIDKNGSTKWSVTYNISNPKVEVKGEYAFIGDIKDVDGYLFTKLGKLINIASDDLIEKFSLSENGDVAILSRSGNESYVYLYDRSGKNGDVYIKYVRNEDGEPFDIALSNDGKLLMVSLCKVENEKIHSYVKIYNFDSEVYMDNDDRLIKTIDSYYDDKMIAKVDFLDNEHAVCFYDGGLTFFDINKKMIDEINENILLNNSADVNSKRYNYEDIVKEKDIKKENIIHSVYVEKDNAYIVLENDRENKNLYTLIRYDKSGNERLKKDFNKEYISFYVTNGCSVFMGLDDLMLIDNFGIIRYDGRFLDNYVYIRDMFHLGFMDLVVGLDNSLKRMWIY